MAGRSYKDFDVIFNDKNDTALIYDNRSPTLFTRNADGEAIRVEGLLADGYTARVTVAQDGWSERQGDGTITTYALQADGSLNVHYTGATTSDYILRPSDHLMTAADLQVDQQNDAASRQSMAEYDARLAAQRAEMQRQSDERQAQQAEQQAQQNANTAAMLGGMGTMVAAGVRKSPTPAFAANTLPALSRLPAASSGVSVVAPAVPFGPLPTGLERRRSEPFGRPAALGWPMMDRRLRAAVNKAANLSMLYRQAGSPPPHQRAALPKVAARWQQRRADSSRWRVPTTACRCARRPMGRASGRWSTPARTA